VSGDYFSLLAARTLGIAPRLGPIVSARFEPARHRMPFDEAIEERLLPAVPLPPAEEPRLDASPLEDAAPPQRDVIAPGVMADRPLRPRNEPLPHHPRPAPASSTPAPLPPRAAAASTRLTPAAPGQPSQDAFIPPHRDDAPPTATLAQNDFDPFEDTIPLVPLSVSPPPTRRQVMEAASASQDGASKPPTVIVRIGRVDVRAVSDPTPPPAASNKRAASRPSLADHLRARDQGRR
jgi:hypothetical protein